MIDAGGLYIVGTERHESRRIDNQLRGRSGRQGDPGESRFFLSAEDDLIRLFAGDRIYRILDRLGGVDVDGNEEPIEAGLLSKQIEKAQRKVEEQHFLARKHTLEYDDVMNEQRRVIYELRDQVLEGANLSQARGEVAAVLERTIEQYTAGDYVEDWDLDALFAALSQIYPVSLSPASFGSERVDQTELIEQITEDAIRQYDAREAELGEELMRALERFLLLQIIDERWREHLHDMDYLREGIHLRGFAQIEPLVAYKNEAFTLFEDLMNSVWTDFARLVFHVEVQHEAPNGGSGGAAAALLPARRQLDRQRVARELLLRCHGGRRGARRRGRRRGSRGAGGPRPRRAAPRLHRRAARAQRPVLVWLGQEVQALPRGMTSAPSSEPTPARLAAIRDQLQLLADYL